MTNQAIHFGTSGWRGIIAEDFTFPGVRRASAAIAGHVLAQKKSPTLIVGYDTRFFSPKILRWPLPPFCGPMAAACSSAAKRRRLPTIAHAIIHGKLDGGVNITASHNPAEYNGLKFSGPDGGPALPEITKDIEKRAAALEDGPARSHRDRRTTFERINPREPYFEQLRRMIRFDVLRKSKRQFRLRRRSRLRRGLAGPHPCGSWHCR